MYKKAGEVIKFTENTMQNCWAELTAERKSSTEVTFHRRIVQYNALSILLLVGKNEKSLETLTKAARIYSKDIGMTFGIEKYAMTIIKSGKWYTTEGIEPYNQEKIRTLGEKETYKYLVILEADTIKHSVMKEKETEYHRRTRKLLEIRWHSRNLIKGINAFVRYSRPFLERTSKEL